MKRISLLALALCATWASGCCCPYYSRHAYWDDSCVQAQDSCPEEYREPRRKGRHKRRRGDKGNRCEVADNCGGDCCDSCCGSCCDGGCSSCGPTGSPSLPMTYDGAGSTMGGGCASGNCGMSQTQTPGSSGQMYGGMPFDANSGWTVQSTTSHPVGNEPILAPPSSGTPITPAPARSQGWVPASSPSSNPSSAPSPGPVPPVSYSR
jgi:hypothetical protein